ncbi:response regulator transcription factor [Saprospiraceae bacterium]|nr:response regulator transcription factor [Saprospiraceae bacterium]MDC3219519.1 response regulator transcription factor [Saprospiraceae bacterium]
MNCIIIEDQPPAQRILKKYIEDLGTLKLKATFSNAIQAMDFLKTEEIDLIFLDIHLPKISGIDFLKSLSNPPSIILTTAFSEYALESYEFNVVDYLLKPFSFQRFVKAISKMPTKNIGQVSEKLKNSKKEIFIKSGYEHIKVIIDNIFYIKSDADYTEIFLADKKHLSSEPLRYWLENLDNNQFMRIHKSYIINTFKIEKVASNQVFLNEKMIIPIGRAFKESFAERFLK